MVAGAASALVATVPAGATDAEFADATAVIAADVIGAGAGAGAVVPSIVSAYRFPPYSSNSLNTLPTPSMESRSPIVTGII